MSIADQYDVLELIGRGSFGLIRKVRRKSDGHILVRKEIAYHRMSDKERKQLNAECGILAQVKHPNIVEYYTKDHVKADASLHLYMEYCGNGDLSQTIKECRSVGKLLPEAMIWTYFTQIVLALYRCHNGVNPPPVGNLWEKMTVPIPPDDKVPIKILHRDLKPENIFLGENGDVKLGDFGLSKMLAPEQQLTTTYVGTPYYMSPEIVSDLPYTNKSDIWSLGCIIYELCQLSPPFNAKTQWSLIDKIKTGKYAPIPKQYSPELRHVIDICLKVDPSKRPDTAALLEMEIFKIMHKEREIVLLHRHLQAAELTLKSREEDILRKEQQLLQKAEEMRKDFEERSIQMHGEIDASLRAQWESLAHQELQRLVDQEVAKRISTELEPRIKAEVDSRVQAEIAARLEIEVFNTIRSLDLIPRLAASAAAREISPPSTASLSSSAASTSGFNSTPAFNITTNGINTSAVINNTHIPFNHTSNSATSFGISQQSTPDSPADVTMHSPGVALQTPGPKRHVTTNGPPPKFARMLPDDSPIRAQSVPVPNFTSGAPENLSMPPPPAPPKSQFPSSQQPKRNTTQISHATASANGSPVRIVGPTRTRSGFNRAGTTGMTSFDQTQTRDRREYGLGGRGLSLDDVATERDRLRDRDRDRDRDKGRYQGLGKRQLGLQPAPKWDPLDLDAPSPFKKSMIMRNGTGTGMGK
ncbi:kinase-like domain-containing protein [Pyronema omphalodes]|nr:kinase-like domain-containing protein [Pyronema omphalodes]